MAQRQQFLNFDKPEFVDDFVYTPPFEVMDRALKVNQEGMDTAIATANLFNNINIDYIDDEQQRQRVGEIINKYAGQADNVAALIRQDPSKWRQQGAALSALKNQLAQDFQYGEIYRTQKNAENWKASQAELAKITDFTTRQALKEEAMQKWRASYGPEKEGGEGRWNTALYERTQGIDRPDMVGYLKNMDIKPDEINLTKDLFDGKTYDSNFKNPDGTTGALFGFDQFTGKWGYIREVKESEKRSYDKVQNAINGYMALPETIAFEKQQERLRQAGLLDERYYDDEGNRLSIGESSWKGAAQMALQLGQDNITRSDKWRADETALTLWKENQANQRARKQREADLSQQLKTNGVRLNDDLLAKSTAYQNLKKDMVTDVVNLAYGHHPNSENNVLGNVSLAKDPVAYIRKHLEDQIVKYPDNKRFQEAYEQLQRYDKDLEFAQTAGDHTFYEQLKRDNPNMSEEDLLKASITYTKSLRDVNNRHSDVIPFELAGFDSKFTISDINSGRWRVGSGANAKPRVGAMGYNPTTKQLEKVTEKNKDTLKAIESASYQNDSASPITIPSANNREQWSNNVIKIKIAGGGEEEVFAVTQHNIKDFGSTFVNYDFGGEEDSEKEFKYDQKYYKAEKDRQAALRKKVNMENQSKQIITDYSHQIKEIADPGLSGISGNTPYGKQAAARARVAILWGNYSKEMGYDKKDEAKRKQFIKELLNTYPEISSNYFASDYENWLNNSDRGNEFFSPTIK